MLKLSDIHKHNASTFMYKYIKEKPPSSFNGMVAPFVEPNLIGHKDLNWN